MIEAVHIVQHRDLEIEAHLAVLRKCRILVCNPEMDPRTLRDAGINGALFAYINAHMLPLYKGSRFYEPFQEAMRDENFYYRDSTQPDRRLRASEYDQPEFKVSLRCYWTLAQAILDIVRANGWDDVYLDDCTDTIPMRRAMRIAPHWNQDHDQMQLRWAACRDLLVRRLSTYFRCVIANTAGWTSKYLDGITIEKSHILAHGVFWAASRFLEQDGGLNVAWDYDLRYVSPGLTISQGATRLNWATEDGDG